MKWCLFYVSGLKVIYILSYVHEQDQIALTSPHNNVFIMAEGMLFLLDIWRMVNPTRNLKCKLLKRPQPTNSGFIRTKSCINKCLDFHL